MQRAVKNTPAAQLKGVLPWNNHLAREEGGRECEDFGELPIKIASRRKQADRYVFEASHCLQDILTRHTLDCSGLIDGPGETY